MIPHEPLEASATVEESPVEVEDYGLNVGSQKTALPQEKHRGKDGRRHQRLHVHDASLTSNPAALGWIGYRLSTLVHVAQTARREFHSSFVPSLKDTQPGDPEKRKEQEPPTPWRSETKEDAGE